MCFENTPKTLKYLMRNCGCTLHNLPETVSLESDILSYKAVISQKKLIVNVGDFVKVTSCQSHVSTTINE